MENNGLPDGFGIGVMLPESTLNQITNMEYNNATVRAWEYGNISTSNNISVSTLNSPSVTSTNDEGFSLFIPINEKIQYSYYSKT